MELEIAVQLLCLMYSKFKNEKYINGKKIKEWIISENFYTILPNEILDDKNLHIWSDACANLLVKNPKKCRYLYKREEHGTGNIQVVYLQAA